jgi:hypothetical protein
MKKKKWVVCRSLKDIAREFGCSKNKIRKDLLKAGLELRSKSTQATDRRDVSAGKQGALPYFGFCYLEGKIVKDPREFPTLQMIHQCWQGKRTAHQIVQELNHLKILSRTGKTWSWAAVQNILDRFELGKVSIQKGGRYEFGKSR